MRRRPVVDPRFPARLRELREQRGLSLRDLARRALSSKSHIQMFETGVSTPSADTARRLDEALGAGGDIAALVRMRAGLATAAQDSPLGATAPLVERLRKALLVRKADASRLTEHGLVAIEATVGSAHDAYQRCDYLTAATLLPAAIAAAEHHARAASADGQRHAHRTLAVANVAASKLTAKAGDGGLAWMTADRATSSAMLADDRALSGIAAYQVACAMLRLPGRLNDAQAVVADAIDDLSGSRAHDRQAELSAWGALLLLGAIVAARRADRASAHGMLATADRVAGRLRDDRNDMWSGFGPTNVAIHKVSIAVELQEPDVAIAIGEGLDTSGLPPALLGRRAQVHVDLAAAFAMKHDDAPAVLHLLEAERIAPQVTTVNHAVRMLLVELLQHERRVVTPGLRALAQRAGVA